MGDEEFFKIGVKNIVVSLEAALRLIATKNEGGTSKFEKNKAECLKLFEKELNNFGDDYFRCQEYEVFLKYKHAGYLIQYSHDDCLKYVKEFIKSITRKKNDKSL